MSKIAPPDRRSTGFQTHLKRRFAPGRFEGIGYAAGLEIQAAKNGQGMICRQFATANWPCRRHEDLRAAQHGYFAHVQKWGEPGLIVPAGALSRRAPALCGLFLSLSCPLGLFVRLYFCSMVQNAYEPPPPMYTVVAPVLLLNTSKLRRRLSLDIP
jgi:hypothetical protein